MREGISAGAIPALKKLLAIPGVVCEQPEGAFYLMAKLPVDSTDQISAVAAEGV